MIRLLALLLAVTLLAPGAFARDEMPDRDSDGDRCAHFGCDDGEGDRDRDRGDDPDGTGDDDRRSGDDEPSF